MPEVLLADMGVFEKHANESSGDYLLELLQEIEHPGCVLNRPKNTSRNVSSG